jgi:predicted kinase
MEALEIGLWDEEARTRIEKLQWRLGQDLLALGQNVVIEWGTWAQAERDTLRAGARAVGAAVELHFVDAPVEVLFERTGARKMEEPPITLEQIKRWAEIFEPPSPEELALFDPPLTLEPDERGWVARVS